MEDLEIKITREHYISESTEQLSNLLTEEFATSDEVKSHEYVYTSPIDKNECRLTDTSMISIEALKKIINKIEATGATHVAIDYHCDHDEYDIYGFKVERASEETIRVWNEMEELKANRQKTDEIAKLEKKLESLKNK